MLFAKAHQSDGTHKAESVIVKETVYRQSALGPALVGHCIHATNERPTKLRLPPFLPPFLPPPLELPPPWPLLALLLAELAELEVPDEPEFALEAVPLPLALLPPPPPPPPAAPPSVTVNLLQSS